MSMINNSTPVKNGGDDINPTCYKDFDKMTFLGINHNYFKLTDFFCRQYQGKKIESLQHFKHFKPRRPAEKKLRNSALVFIFVGTVHTLCCVICCLHPNILQDLWSTSFFRKKKMESSLKLKIDLGVKNTRNTTVEKHEKLLANPVERHSFSDRRFVWLSMFLQ